MKVTAHTNTKILDLKSDGPGIYMSWSKSELGVRLAP